MITDRLVRRRNESKKSRSAKARRALTALALAVALAAPTAQFGAHYAFAADAAPVAATPAAAPDGHAALQAAVDQYKSGQYEESLTALQAIKADNLSAADQKLLSDTIAQAEQAAQSRRAARADFEKGQTALEAGDNAAAMTLFKSVANNQYADEGTKAKANEQIAVAEAGVKGQQGDLKSTYESAVADYKAGNYASAKTKFTTLQDAGYKAPWFSKSPRDYLNDIEKQTAGPSDAEQARAAYLTGRDQYRKGDWIAARESFNKAVALNYKPGWFEDAPSKYLERMDKKEQADAQKAAQQAMLAQGSSAPETNNTTNNTAVVAAAVPADTSKAVTPPVAAPSAPHSDSQVNPGDRVVAMDNSAAQSAAPTAADATPAATPATNPTPANHQTAVVHAPTAAASDTEQDELARIAAARRAKQQNDAIQAQQLVKSAEAAENAQRYQEALGLYTQAVTLDPRNGEAQAGRSRALNMTGTTVAPTNDALSNRAEAQILARRQAVTFSFNQAISEAQMATSQGKFDAAAAAISRADAASKSDPTIFQNSELQAFDAQLASARQAREAAIQADTARRAEEARVAAANDAANRARQQEEAKNRTIASLVADSRRLTDQGKYDQALKVVNQILVIDPRNEYALGIRPILFDRASLQYQREQKEAFNREWVNSFDALEEKKVPYSDVLKFPTNWPDLSAKRDQTVRDERNVTAADEALTGILDKSLPEIRFQDVAFADVIDFLRDTTQANIFVNWKALEAAGIDRNAPVSTRLRNVKFSKVLRTILDSLGGGATIKLGYTVDEGVITISTEEDLARNVDTRTYDIRDLLLAIPDFDDAPTFDLSQATQQTQNQGGGNTTGGRANNSSSGSLFSGGQTGNESEKNTPTRDELVEQITSLIRETIGVGTWKEDGGQLGSLRELGGQLIVTQTPEIHRQITALLEKLREQRSIQVMIETRFLTVQRNFLEDIGVDFDFYFNFDNNQVGSFTPGVGGFGGTGIDAGVGSISNITNPVTGGVQTGVGPVAVQQNSSNFTVPGSLQTGVNGNLGAEFGTPNLQTTINAFLDDFQASILIRATQGNQNVTQLTAPRLTLFNGQEAYVLVSRQIAYVSDLTPIVAQGAVGFDPTVSTIQSGVVLSVKAVVSADRKYVTLTLQPQLANIIAIRSFQVSASAITNQNGGGNTGGGTTGDVIPVGVSGFIQEPELQITRVATSVSVPDGGTLLLGGTTVSGEIEREAGVPVLSKIPFLKRAFTNRGFAQDESVLLILVKPTIIIQREVEQDNFPLLTSRTQ